MKLAVISDIHGNLTALNAVLDDLSTQTDIELTWCLGDLAAFGPRPSACVKKIKSLSEENEGKTFRVIGGNTDRYLVNGVRPHSPSAKDEESFKQLASEWQTRDTLLNWGLAQLSWEDYEYLKKIRHRELAHEVKDYGWVIGYHGIPGDDETFLNSDTSEEEALDYLLDREGRLAIGGHTHREMDRQLGEWRIVNVGSVGLSFTKPGTAVYGIFEFSNDSVNLDIRYVPYNVEEVIDDLLTVGYPHIEWLKTKIHPTKDTA